MENKKTYKIIDIVKLLCAFLVVAIHTEPFRNYIWIERGFNIITRFAVPFFFIASGYFLFSKGYDKEKIKHQLLRIVKLYLVWSVIYLPVYIINALNNNTGIFNFLLSFFWNGTWTQFWYLVATIYAIVIIYFLFPLLKEKGMVILVSVIYIIGLFVSTYSPIVSKLIGFEISVETRNAVFFALPYMFMGAYLAINKDFILYSLSMIKRIILAAVFVAGMAAEAMLMIVKFNTSQTVLWFCLLPATMIIFIICLNNEIKIGFDTSGFRICSTLIYTSHCLFQFILKQMGVDKGMIQFLLVLAVSVCFSVAVFFISKKVKVLKHLY